MPFSAKGQRNDQDSAINRAAFKKYWDFLDNFERLLRKEYGYGIALADKSFYPDRTKKDLFWGRAFLHKAVLGSDTITSCGRFVFRIESVGEEVCISVSSMKGYGESFETFLDSGKPKKDELEKMIGKFSKKMGAEISADDLLQACREIKKPLAEEKARKALEDSLQSLQRKDEQFASEQRVFEHARNFFEEKIASEEDEGMLHLWRKQLKDLKNPSYPGSKESQGRLTHPTMTERVAGKRVTSLQNAIWRAEKSLETIFIAEGILSAISRRLGEGSVTDSEALFDDAAQKLISKGGVRIAPWLKVLSVSELLEKAGARFDR